MSKLNTDGKRKEFGKKFGDYGLYDDSRTSGEISEKVWSFIDKSLQLAYQKGYRAGRKLTHKKLEAWVTEGIPKQNKQI